MNILTKFDEDAIKIVASIVIDDARRTKGDHKSSPLSAQVS